MGIWYALIGLLFCRIEASGVPHVLTQRIQGLNELFRVMMEDYGLKVREIPRIYECHHHPRVVLARDLFPRHLSDLCDAYSGLLSVASDSRVEAEVVDEEYDDPCIVSALLRRNVDLFFPDDLFLMDAYANNGRYELVKLLKLFLSTFGIPQTTEGKVYKGFEQDTGIITTLFIEKLKRIYSISTEETANLMDIRPRAPLFTDEDAIEIIVWCKKPHPEVLHPVATNILTFMGSVTTSPQLISRDPYTFYKNMMHDLFPKLSESHSVLQRLRLIVVAFNVNSDPEDLRKIMRLGCNVEVLSGMEVSRHKLASLIAKIIQIVVNDGSTRDAGKVYQKFQSYIEYFWKTVDEPENIHFLTNLFTIENFPNISTVDAYQIFMSVASLVESGLILSNCQNVRIFFKSSLNLLHRLPKHDPVLNRLLVSFVESAGAVPNRGIALHDPVTNLMNAHHERISSDFDENLDCLSKPPTENVAAIVGVILSILVVSTSVFVVFFFQDDIKERYNDFIRSNEVPIEQKSDLE